MNFAELFLIALGVSMDAFAVSLCKGTGEKKASLSQMALVGLWFGGFQALMPFLGYLLGGAFVRYIEKIDHWVAFALLIFIGGKMIRDSFHPDGEESGSLRPKDMFLAAVATSIDALAVGISFSCLEMSITAVVPGVLLIGFITFLFSAAGVRLGSLFGARFQNKAEIAGGVILILIGLKILLEHLGLIAF